MREEQNYFDVTLACDGGHQIEAHKVILSAGSAFFRKTFGQTKHPSPFIYLRGIKRFDLENVVDFLYNGEAYVAQGELEKFLETAQELQVKGLQSNLEHQSDQYQTLEASNVESKFPKIDNTYKTPMMDELIRDSLEELVETKDVALISSQEDNFVVGSNEDLDLQIDQMIEKNDELWICKVCSKTVKKRHEIRNHAETHIEGITHACHICNKASSTRTALRMHIIDNHSQLSFDCNICGKMKMTKMVFKSHKQRCKK